MSEGWKRLDLAGVGLQRANLELAARLKRRGRAWALLAAAPLGLHRAYLDDPKGAWSWRIATALALGAALWDWRIAAALVAAMVVALVHDAWWIDRRVTALNKRIRRQVFLAGEAPPPGYAGRDPDPPRQRPSSFAEQESALRAAASGAARGARDAPPAETHALAARRPMKRGFYTIMAAQFFSSLADNALLIAAIQLLAQLHGPAWMVPLLKFFFTVSYVLLAAFVGAFADSMPKGRVMFITNLIKVGGCVMMFFYAQLTLPGTEPFLAVLVAYAIVGLGAAAYSPAKYGILTELLPPSQLVAANGWIEGLTVGSIILGTLLGGVLVSDAVSTQLLAFDLPHIDTHVDTPGEAAIAVIVLGYLTAAAFNLFIPDTGVDHHVPKKNPFYLIRDFAHCNNLLWKDKLGQISLATTTLFWGAGATLQFIVLEWARAALGYPLSKATALQGITAVGIALGAVVAARFVSLRQAVSVLPVGVAMGLIVIGMNFVRDLWLAIPLLVAVGALAGFFVVPMNALLQHRGHILMGAGHSIAVQNFNENLSILVMLALYAVMIRAELSIYTVIVLFGLFVSASMVLVRQRHLYNQRHSDSLHLIGMDKPRH